MFIMLNLIRVLAAIAFVIGMMIVVGTDGFGTLLP